MDASLRFSPLKFTKCPPERSSYLPSNKNINRLQSNRYYCHYSNALYMGGMDSFKKNGYGVMLMDSGTCAITCYSHDTPVETHIIFREKSLTIVTLNGKKTKTVTYRSGAHLLTASYNNRNFIEGIGYLIDFIQNKLYKLSFYQSKVDRKQQIKDQRILNNIFVNLQYSDILDDPSHIQYLFMNFNISNISSVKDKSTEDGDIYNIGFLNRNKKQARANGLVFRIMHNNKPDEFCFKLLERGYLQGQKLEKFGQRHYDNGNYYIGGFKNDLFEGYGVLVHPQENKWTYGVYKKGQLIDIIQSSINSKCKLQEILKKVHEDEDTYIQSYAKMIPNESELKILLSNSLDENISVQIIEDPKQQALRTLSNLKSIKDDYIKRQYQSKTQQTIIQQLGKQRSKMYKSYVEGLPLKQSSPMTYKSPSKSKSKSKSKQIKNEAEPVKSQKNLLNYELKQSKAGKQKINSRQKSRQKQVHTPNVNNKKQKNINTPSKKNQNSTTPTKSKSNEIQKQQNYQIKIKTPNANNRQKPIVDRNASYNIKQLILIKEQNNEEDKQKKDQITYEQKLQEIDKQIQKEKTKRNHYHAYNFNNQDTKQDSPSTLNNTKSVPYYGTHSFNRTSNNPQDKANVISTSRPSSRYQYTDVDEPLGYLKPYYPSQLHLGGCYEEPYSRQKSTTVSGLPFENQTDYQLQKDLYKKVYKVGYLKAFSRIYPEELQRSRSKSIQLKESRVKSGQKQKPISRRGFKYKYQTQQDEYGEYRAYLQEQLIRRRNELREKLINKYGFDRH